MDKDVLKILQESTINEMSIERQQLTKRCASMSDIYAEHIQKIVYFGDISASWRESIWKSICYIPKRVFADTKKLPDADFILNNFIVDAFGVEYLENPLEAIRKKIATGVSDIQKNAKHGLDDPREVIYPFASENVKSFNEDIIELLTHPPLDFEDVEVLITQHLAIEQTPWS